MAIQELLKASYTGSLGETTGAKWKNKAVVKGKIWSKTPNNKTQTDSVRSFECLNRVASAIASQWFYRLGIKAVNMHKHNAVAKLLKSSVKTHEFIPESFLEVFHEDETVSIKSLSVDYGTGTISFSAETTYKPQVEKSESWLVVVFNQLGQVFYADSPRETAVSMSFDAPVTESDMIYILACSSKKIKNRVVLGGAIASKGTRYAQLDVVSLDPNLTEDNNAYELNVQLSESLPSGSYEIPIITHALRQTVMIDTPMSAFLVTADSQEAKLRFVPALDSLDQKDVFDMGAYIRVEPVTLRIGDVVYTLSESSLVAQYKKDVSYRLAEDVKVYAVANGFDFIFNSQVPEGFNFTLEDTAFYSVGLKLAKEEINNASSTGTWNAGRTVYNDDWGKSLVYTISQAPLRGGKFSLFCTSQQTGSIIKYESNIQNVNPYTRRLSCGSIDKTLAISGFAQGLFGIKSSQIIKEMVVAPTKVKTIYNPSGSEINIAYTVSGSTKVFTLDDYKPNYHNSNINGWYLPSIGSTYSGLKLLQATSSKPGTVELEIETVANTSYNYLIGIVCVYEHSTQML